MQQVKDLPKWDRIKFYNSVIDQIKDTLYPAKFQNDRDCVLADLEERKEQIIRGEA